MADYDWDQFRRDAAHFQQLKALQDIQKQLAAKPGPPSHPQPVPVEPPKPRYRCPHCGGGLPNDAGRKQYPKCKNCRGDLYWFIASPGSFSQATPFTDRSTADSHVASRLLTGVSCAASANRHTTGFSLYACGVIAAFDGRLTKNEIDAVVEGLTGTGMSKESIKSQFIKACQRVHGDGVDTWIDRLAAMMHDGEGKQHKTGVPPLELLRLMQRLFILSGGETSDKYSAFQRLVKVITSG
jgi:hypothetical protein